MPENIIKTSNILISTFINASSIVSTLPNLPESFNCHFITDGAACTSTSYSRLSPHMAREGN